MKYNLLGSSKILVSEICLGSLTMGGLQKGSTQKQIDKVVARCVERGINFLDTAELYDSYNVAKSLVNRNKDAVIASKSYAYDKATAKAALDGCLRAINRDYVDVFLMHEQESIHTIRGHFEALEYYISMKKEGKIRAVGLSTHRVEGIIGANKTSEVEIVHPLFNYKGFGLFDGTLKDMQDNLIVSSRLNKGIYAMKIFGGGHLLNDTKSAIDFIKTQSFVNSSAIGMQSIEEVDYNCDLFEGKIPQVVPSIQNKRVKVHDWCVGCMSCASKCPQNAIQKQGNTVIIDEDKCVLCGYCGGACKELCIKII